MRRGPIIVLCIWLATPQTLSAAIQDPQNSGHRSGKAKVDYVIRRDEAHSIAIGTQGREIRVGTETKILPDLKLLDQDGRRINFYSDLIKDKIVLISFFYTSCTYTCLMQGKVFSELQAELGERLGKEVFLISVTMDPETDTPERLKSWAAQHGLKKGWTLVTGGKNEMAMLVGHLTGNPLGRIELHSPFIYIGNDKRNTWAATYGLDEPKKLIQRIEEIRL